ncbi:MAG TPA: hypothetical protein VNK04_09750 [Gemmataceae bacterium]|nr:hypothetical protein [Gemmataceae bacterium]
MRRLINVVVAVLLAILAFSIFIAWIAQVRHQADRIDPRRTLTRPAVQWERP